MNRECAQRYVASGRRGPGAATICHGRGAHGAFLRSVTARCCWLLIALPAMLFLISKPEYILMIILFMRFTNFDIFLPMRLFRPLSLLLVASIVAVWLDGRKIEMKDRLLAVLMIAFVLIAFQSMAFAEKFTTSTDAFESLTGVILVIAAMLLLVRFQEIFPGLSRGADSRDADK